MKKQESDKPDIEIEKLKLRAEHGAQFDPNLPEEVEDDFVRYIKAFNEAAMRKETKKVCEVLGNPEFAPVDQLSDNELPSAIDELLHRYEAHQMQICSMYEVEDRDFYRFLTEDLPMYEMNVINIPGSFTTFTYEDWYPNDVEDIKKTAREFLEMLFDRSFQHMYFHLDRACILAGEAVESKEYGQRLEKHLAHLHLLKMDQLVVEEPIMCDGSATVYARTSYTMIAEDGIQESREEKVKLTFAEFLGYWSIRQVKVEGLGIR